MNHLQLVCILSVIAIAHASGDSKEEDEKIVEECKKETKASDEDVKLFEAYEFPKTKTQACLTTCYYKKRGVMNDDNSINIDKEIEEFTAIEKEDKEFHEKYVKIMKECHAKYTPVKECDSIKTYFDCMQNSAKEAGIPLDK